MAYLGQPLDRQSSVIREGNGTGGLIGSPGTPQVVFPMGFGVAADVQVLVFIDGVKQDTDAYSVTGSDCTFTVAPGNGVNLDFVGINTMGLAIEPSDGSVSPTKLQAGQYGGDYIKISDVKPSGTNGGNFASGAWRTRDLNTLDNDTAGLVTLNANQFTLQAGTYRIFAFLPAYTVSNHQSRLHNITDSSLVILGGSMFTTGVSGITNHSIIMGEFTIAAAKTFEVQHYCSVTKSTGFGQVGGVPGGDEVYTTVELWRVK